MTIAAILKQKGPDIISVLPTTTIAQVAQTLSARRIGAVLVMDTARQLVGILSERDVMQALAQHGARALDMTAAQLMTREVQTIGHTTTIAQAMTMMTQGRFRHIPVMRGAEVSGVVSIGDVVKAWMMDAEQEVDSLKAYVAGVG